MWIKIVVLKIQRMKKERHNYMVIYPHKTRKKQTDFESGSEGGDPHCNFIHNLVSLMSQQIEVLTEKIECMTRELTDLKNVIEIIKRNTKEFQKSWVEIAKSSNHSGYKI